MWVPRVLKYSELEVLEEIAKQVNVGNPGETEQLRGYVRQGMEKVGHTSAISVLYQNADK
eukprot:scaffold24265_cov19-Tisochrysis_lutea.AAC.3